MECPRCGEPLTTFRLGDARAVVCEACEYVGVPADLRPADGEEPESWEEALARFARERDGADPDA